MARITAHPPIPEEQYNRNKNNMIPAFNNFRHIKCICEDCETADTIFKNIKII